MLKIKNLTLISLLFIAFVAVIFANNRYVGSDPRASLLVSEAIITKGTIKLDHYGQDLLDRYGDVLHKKNDHYYYYFPIGTSLASLPFVAVANGIGIDMVKREPEVQIFIAALTSIATLLVLVKLASLFLNVKSASIVAAIFWFGTSLSSTAGTALWSHNFATLFALLAIYLSIRAAKLNESQPWCLIGIFLFSAYLSRPTMALLSPFLLLFVLSYSRVAALKAGVIVALLLGAFSLFSMHEFGQILPDYYLPKRLAGGYFYEALYGNLLSPARGLFIYSPFIIFSWLCFKHSEKSWGLKNTWFLVAVAWPLAHLIFISRFPQWWAGWSYGARFMTDVLPGIFLLTLYTWPNSFKNLPAKLLALSLFISSGFAIVVNTGQGLFNKYTAAWNADPNIDQHLEYLFDWQYPQFLSTKGGHASRIIRHEMKNLQPINPGATQNPTSKMLIYSGWSRVEEAEGAEAADVTYRWSEGNNPRIIFKVDSPEKFEGILRLYFGTLGEQQITITLNGTEIYSGTDATWDKILDSPFNSTLLKNGINTLAFELPNARPPGNGDDRVLALALKSFQIR